MLLYCVTISPLQKPPPPPKKNPSNISYNYIQWNLASSNSLGSEGVQISGLVARIIVKSYEGLCISEHQNIPTKTDNDDRMYVCMYVTSHLG